jgi:hypothetical protein
VRGHQPIDTGEISATRERRTHGLQDSEQQKRDHD